MTPCEKLGYKVGDKFGVIGNHYNLKKGTEVYLAEDDGSEYPKFRAEGVDDYWFVFLKKLKPIKEFNTLNLLNIDWVIVRTLLTHPAFEKEEKKQLLATRHDIIDAMRETGAALSLHDAMEIAETLLDKFNIEK